MNTNMTGFRCFSKIFFVIVLWMKVASALQGLSVNFNEILEGKLLVMLSIVVLLQFYLCLQGLVKIVMLIFGAVSINGLNYVICY